MLATLQSLYWIELNLLHIQIDPNTGRKKKPLDIERVNNNT
jgi:hypothetical protein